SRIVSKRLRNVEEATAIFITLPRVKSRLNQSYNDGLISLAVRAFPYSKRSSRFILLISAHQCKYPIVRASRSKVEAWFFILRLNSSHEFANLTGKLVTADVSNGRRSPSVHITVVTLYGLIT